MDQISCTGIQLFSWHVKYLQHRTSGTRQLHFIFHGRVVAKNLPVWSFFCWLLGNSVFSNWISLVEMKDIKRVNIFKNCIDNKSKKVACKMSVWVYRIASADIRQLILSVGMKKIMIVLTWSTCFRIVLISVVVHVHNYQQENLLSVAIAEAQTNGLLRRRVYIGCLNCPWKSDVTKQLISH